MDNRKKQSILQRFWRKISGQRVSQTRADEDIINTAVSTTQHPVLPTIAHAASFSSSTSSINECSEGWKDDKRRRRASMPITQVEAFRDADLMKHGHMPLSESESPNSSTTTMVNNSTKFADETPRPILKRPTKIPQSHRRRTFDMGDTFKRTITMTNGFYDTLHDKGRVKVDIHEPMPESPSLSPQLAGRTPLHLLGNKKKKDAIKLVREGRVPLVLKPESMTEVFVLEPSMRSPSPFFSPDPVKLEIAQVDYHLHPPAQIHHHAIGLPATPVPSAPDFKKEESLPARRIMLEPSGPPPPMSLPPTPLKGRLRLDFASPSKSPSRIPIATKPRYFSFATSPKHRSPTKAEADRRRSDL